MNTKQSTASSHLSGYAGSVNQTRQPTSHPLSTFQVVQMLAWREWIRFFRQPFRVVAGLGQPILFWILFGTGMHSSFRGDNGSTDFMTYFMPGTVAMILLFTAIFATITVIEDRREGFLQSVLVAPTPRWAIALGKAIGSAAIAWAQSLVFLLIAFAVGSVTLGLDTIFLISFMLLVSIAVSSLGICCAWPMNSTQEFHSLMSLVLMPMWLLSGAFFPVPAVASGDPIGQLALHWVMRCNPMTYGVSGLRHLMFPLGSDDRYWVPSMLVSLEMTIAFAVLTTIAAAWIVNKKQKGELS